MTGTLPTKTMCYEREETTDDKEKEAKPLEFHIPAPILAKIVSIIADGGPAAVKNWILPGKEGKAAVFSKETLSQVRRDRNPLFVRMSKPLCTYFSFYAKCLEQGNPYALFVESLRLAFCESDLLAAIEISTVIKDVFPVATLLHVMLCSCSGVEDIETLKKFKRQQPVFADIERLGNSLIRNIKCVEPKRADTYAKPWRFVYYPDCWKYHMWHMDHEGMCTHCIYYYLSRYIRLLS